ncbi:MAG: hypothetical protein ACXVDI_15915 [Ktedonobacterales bacterium]
MSRPLIKPDRRLSEQERVKRAELVKNARVAQLALARLKASQKRQQAAAAGDRWRGPAQGRAGSIVLPPARYGSFDE